MVVQCSAAIIIIILIIKIIKVIEILTIMLMIIAARQASHCKGDQFCHATDNWGEASSGRSSSDRHTNWPANLVEAACNEKRRKETRDLLNSKRRGVITKSNKNYSILFGAIMPKLCQSNYVFPPFRPVINPTVQQCVCEKLMNPRLISTISATPPYHTQLPIAALWLSCVHSG